MLRWHAKAVILFRAHQFEASIDLLLKYGSVESRIPTWRDWLSDGTEMSALEDTLLRMGGRLLRLCGDSQSVKEAVSRLYKGLEMRLLAALDGDEGDKLKLCEVLFEGLKGSAEFMEEYFRLVCKRKPDKALGLAKTGLIPSDTVIGVGSKYPRAYRCLVREYRRVGLFSKSWQVLRGEFTNRVSEHRAQDIGDMKGDWLRYFEKQWQSNLKLSPDSPTQLIVAPA